MPADLLLPALLGSTVGLLSVGATLSILDGRHGRMALCLAGLLALVAAARMGVGHAW